MSIWEGLLSACATALTGIVVALGAFAVRYISVRTAAIADATKRAAVDDAVAAVEEQSRQQTELRGGQKVAAALRIAEESTPKSVAITPADVQAGVTRLRASLPTPSSIPPLSIPVSMASSEPPAPLTPPLAERLPPPASTGFREETTRREKPVGAR